MSGEISGTKQNIRKADIILTCACLFGALLLGLRLVSGQKQGRGIQISYDGTEIENLALNGIMVREGDSAFHDVLGGGFWEEYYCLIIYQDGNVVREYYDALPKIPEGVSYNLLHIAGGEAVMEASDCRDQICVRHRPISADHENIICLPHKLVVEIKDSADRYLSDVTPDDALDGMVK